MNKTLLITGANGQIGQALLQSAAPGPFDLQGLAKNACDITSSQDCESAVAEFTPSMVINCAAFTAVDRAEQEQSLCSKINADGPRYLAETCKNHGVPFFHLSTDYVFDGTAKSPVDEQHPTNPINHYGHSKVAGESAVRETLAEHLILRVMGVFSATHTNFIKTIVHLAQTKPSLQIVADQITCPTPANQIAEVILSMAEQVLIQNNDAWGTYHYCAKPAISWHDFACAFLAYAGSRTDKPLATIEPIASADFKTQSTRPLYSAFDCRKLEQAFGLAPLHWQKSCEEVVESLLESLA